MSDCNGRNGFAIGGLILRLTVGSLILVLGIAAYFISLPPRPNLLGDKGGQAEQSDNSGHSPACDPSKLAKISDAGQRADELKRCQNNADRQRAEDSRRAEARSAQADEEAVWQTYYQSRSGALQTALGVLVLSATVWAAWAARNAAIYAKDAAEAAKDALKHDQRVDEVQVRPYVYVTSEHIDAVMLKRGITEELVFRTCRETGVIEFEFKNFGQTPAKRVRMRAHCFIGGYWNEPFRSKLRSATWVYVGDMAPSVSKKIDDYTVANLAAQYISIKADAKSIIIDGEIEYADAAGRKYRTHFRRACTGEDVDRGSFFVTPKGNEAT